MEDLAPLFTGAKRPERFLEEFDNKLASGTYENDADSFRAALSIIKAGVSQKESLLPCGLHVLNEIIRMPNAASTITASLEQIIATIDSIVQKNPSILALEAAGEVASLVLRNSGFNDFNGRIMRLLLAMIQHADSTCNLEERAVVIYTLGMCIGAGGGSIRANEAKFSAYLLKESIIPILSARQAEVASAARKVLCRLCWVSHVGSINSLSHASAASAGKQTLASSLFEQTLNDVSTMLQTAIEFDVGVQANLQTLTLDPTALPPTPVTGVVARVQAMCLLLQDLIRLAPVSPAANQGTGGVYFRPLNNGGDVLVVVPLVAVLTLCEKVVAHIRRRAAEVVSAISSPIPPPDLAAIAAQSGIAEVASEASGTLFGFSATAEANGWLDVLGAITGLSAEALTAAGVGGGLSCAPAFSKLIHSWTSPIDVPGSTTCFAMLTANFLQTLIGTVGESCPALLSARLPGSAGNAALGLSGAGNSSALGVKACRVQGAVLNWTVKTLRAVVGRPSEAFRLYRCVLQFATVPYTSVVHSSRVLRAAVMCCQGKNDTFDSGDLAVASKRRKGAAGGSSTDAAASMFLSTGKKSGRQTGLQDDQIERIHCVAALISQVVTDLFSLVQKILSVSTAPSNGLAGLEGKVDESVRALLDDTVLRILWSSLKYGAINTNALIGGPNAMAAQGNSIGVAAQGPLASATGASKGPEGALIVGYKTKDQKKDDDSFDFSPLEVGITFFDDLQLANLVCMHMIVYDAQKRDTILDTLDVSHAFRAVSPSAPALIGLLNSISTHDEIPSSGKTRIMHTVSRLTMAASLSQQWQGVSSGYTRRVFAPSKIYEEVFDQSLALDKEPRSISPVLVASRLSHKQAAAALQLQQTAIIPSPTFRPAQQPSATVAAAAPQSVFAPAPPVRAASPLLRSTASPRLGAAAKPAGAAAAGVPVGPAGGSAHAATGAAQRPAPDAAPLSKSAESSAISQSGSPILSSIMKSVVNSAKLEESPAKATTLKASESMLDDMDLNDLDINMDSSDDE